MKDPKPNASYIISQEDYNILKNLSSVDSGAKAALNKSYKGTFKEIITDDKMKQFFGKNYHGILYYDFDAGEWNRYSWEGMFIDDQYISEKHMNELRQALSWMGKMNGFDLLATVVMSVDSKNYPGKGQYVENPVYKPYEDMLVGTLVCRSQQTGRILNPGTRWIGVDRFEDWYGLTQIGISRFAKNIYKEEWFRERVHNLLAQQR